MPARAAARAADGTNVAAPGSASAPKEATPTFGQENPPVIVTDGMGFSHVVYRRRIRSQVTSIAWTAAQRSSLVRTP